MLLIFSTSSAYEMWAIQWNILINIVNFLNVKLGLTKTNNKNKYYLAFAHWEHLLTNFYLWNSFDTIFHNCYLLIPYWFSSLQLNIYQCHFKMHLLSKWQIRYNKIWRSICKRVYFKCSFVDGYLSPGTYFFYRI